MISLRIPGLAALVAVVFALPANAQFGGPISVDLGVGTAPQSITGVISGDVDGDGEADLVAVDSATNGAIGCARGVGGGAYAPPVVSAGTQAQGGAILPSLCDFDQDGFLDLAYADNGATPALYVAPGNPTTAGAFVMASLVIQPLLAGDVVTEVLTTEITGDANLDTLASIRGTNRRISVMPGAGGLTFGPLIAIGTMGDVTDIDVCVDFNRDGRKDVVAALDATAVGAPSRVQVFRGQGTFLDQNPFATLNLPPNTTPTAVHWIDCNYGTDPAATSAVGPLYDLVVSIQGAASAVILVPNVGAPSFFLQGALSQPLAVTNTPLSTIRFEADFDGVEDLSVFAFNSGTPGLTSTNFEVLKIANCVAQSVSVTPGGSFDSQLVVPGKSQLHAMSDQNRDGREDMVVINHTTQQDRVLVFPNLAPANLTITPPKPMLGQKVNFQIQINVPAVFGGRPFAMLLSTQGTTPGTNLGAGLNLPLNPPFLPVIIQGVLPPSGSLTLSPPGTSFGTSPVGFSLQTAIAVVVLGSSGAPIFVTNPAVVTIP